MWKNQSKPEFGTLSDLKVVSASSSLAGPFIATIMGEYGADVIWVENADMPDFTRGTPNWQCEGERRNCRNIALRLKSDEGKEILKELIGRSIPSWSSATYPVSARPAFPST